MFNSPDIGIDIGNSKISVCVRGEGIVASEATYIAWRGDRLTEKNIVALGNEAKTMFEKSGSAVQVTSPMKDGVVIDCRAAGILLRYIVKKAGISPRLARPRVLTGTLFGASPLERKAFADAADALRFRTPYLVEEPLAASIGSGMDITAADANMLVDVGDGATEAIIVAQRRILSGGSMRIGGATIDQKIVSFMKTRHKLRISLSQARKIKQDLMGTGCAGFAVVRGTGVLSRIPEERHIAASELHAVIDLFADQVGEFVHSILGTVPPEVSADLVRNGIYLCGGTSQFLPIREKISAATGLGIHCLDRPQETVIDGIGRMLSYAEYFAS